MIRKLALAVASLCLPIAGLAQTVTGQIVARQYGAWTIPGSTNLVVGTNTNIIFNACLVPGGAGQAFPGLSTNTPVKIVDPNNPAIDEIVTPTVLFSGTSCYVTMTTVNAHPTPYNIVSGTGGFQEAISYAAYTGAANAIVVDAPWFAAGWGSSTIYNAACSPNLSVYAVNIPPGLSYKCNGTHYVPTYAINGFTGTFAAGTAAGTSPTLTASAGNSGNLATLTLLTGTSPAANATLFTFTSGASPNTSGNLNCSVQVAQPAAVTPPAFTVTATSTTVCTVAVATAPPAATTYVFNVSAQ